MRTQARKKKFLMKIFVGVGVGGDMGVGEGRDRGVPESIAL